MDDVACALMRELEAKSHKVCHIFDRDCMTSIITEYQQFDCTPSTIIYKGVHYDAWNAKQVKLFVDMFVHSGLYIVVKKLELV